MNALVRLLLFFSVGIVVFAFAGAYHRIVGSELMVVLVAAGVCLGLLSFIFALVCALLKIGGEVSISAGLGILYGLLIIGAGGFLYVQYFSRLPQLADVSTDTLDPPPFHAQVATFEVVEGQEFIHGTSTRVYDPTDAPVQEQGYPDIKGVYYNQVPELVFRAAMHAARQMPGWKISYSEPKQLHLEAETESEMFHFVDDIAVEVRSKDQGSVVHVRSRSRVGIFDFGVNAMHIRGFLQQMEPSIKKILALDAKKAAAGDPSAVPAATPAAPTAPAPAAAPPAAPPSAPSAAPPPAAANPAPQPAVPPAPAATPPPAKTSAVPNAIKRLTNAPADIKE